MLSPFGVDHPDGVAKSFQSKGRKVGWLLGRVQGDMHALAEPTLRERLAGERRGPSMRQHLASSRINEATKGVRGMNTAYKAGYAIDRYRLPRKAAIAGAAAGVAAAVHHHRAVAKSAFGVEHPVSKAVRLDRALEATRKPAKVKLASVKPASVKTPLADARFGPVKKGAAGVVDDALVTPARVRVAGGRPQKQVPPAEAKPAKPLGQRLNNAIAATGGPSS